MSKRKSSELFEEIQKLVSIYAQKANEWAHFSQRKSTLSAEKFVQLLVLTAIKTPQASLNQLALEGRDLGITLSASALHERMGKEAVMLLAGVLHLAMQDLRQPCPLPIEALQTFSGIYITDSTQIALGESLAPIFAGNQGNSMLKLQVTWDYLHGNLAVLELVEGKNCDQGWRLHRRYAVPGSLQLFDLGYFSQDYLEEIGNQQAYFVSRYQSNTAVYGLNGRERLNLADYLRGCQSNEAELEVYVGRRVQVKVRLLMRRLSQQAADARRRKILKKARRQRKNCTSDYLFLLGWDILLTNLGSQEWDLAHIFDLYAVRFQIEWVFRIWKDQLGLDKIGNWRPERVLCHVYAHLLGAIVVHMLSRSWRWGAFEYSFCKIVQIIQGAVRGLMRCLRCLGWGFGAWLKCLEADFRHFGRKTKRRKSPSTLQIIDNWGLT
jgi:hypothetical protein